MFTYSERKFDEEFKYAVNFSVGGCVKIFSFKNGLNLKKIILFFGTPCTRNKPYINVILFPHSVSRYCY